MSYPPQDFDFLIGSWKIHNRFLNGRLRGSTEWIEFDGSSEVQRLLNPTTGQWSIYWADTVRAGILQPPMIGKFDGESGEFFGDEEVDGRKVLCRFHWTKGNGGSPRWEQAFSADDGKTWETNWVMTFTRLSE